MRWTSLEWLAPSLVLIAVGAACAPAKAPQVPLTEALADADRDGIPDLHDACQSGAEDDRGTERRDGCQQDHVRKAPPAPAPVAKTPARGQVAAKPSHVKVTASRIEIDEKIHFRTGLATIEADSNELLDEVAKSIIDTPDVDFVEIAGHADVRGHATLNLQLTRDRAKAVMDALTSRGVSPKRLRSAGYGAYCPLDPGDDEAAWAKNRRVAFHILRRAGADLETQWGGCPAAESRGVARSPIPEDAPKTVPKPRVALKPRPEPGPAPPPEPLATEQAACDGGDALACMKIGFTTHDEARASGAFTAACALDHLPGCTYAGEWKKACDGGDGAGCERLAFQAEADGRFSAAIGLYEKSCRAAYAPGCHGWGKLTYEGRGTTRDVRFGRALVSHACDRHWKPSCQLAAEIKPKADAPKAPSEEPPAAIARPSAPDSAPLKSVEPAAVPIPKCTMSTPSPCEQACEQNDGRACRLVGIMHAYGVSGVVRDPKLAVSWLGKATARGDIRAHVYLGLVAEGSGKASFETACQADDQLGCVHLGRIEGNRKRFEVACDKGVGRGCLELGAVLEKAKDHEAARSAYDRGCMLGNVASCAGWGSLTVRVSSTVALRTKGFAKLETACQQHYEKACSESKRLSTCAYGNVAACRKECASGVGKSCEKLGELLVEGRLVCE